MPYLLKYPRNLQYIGPIFFIFTLLYVYNKKEGYLSWSQFCDLEQCVIMKISTASEFW